MTRAVITSGLIVALLVWFPAGRAFGSELSGSNSVPTACAQLSNINCFAFGGVGYAGTISPGEVAFHAVLESTNALELFEAILANGTGEAKMYALCGVRRLDPKAFDDFARALKDADPKVRTMSGCLATEENASAVIKRIGDGTYDSYTKR
jgi:hypothetical protein